jgi:hypothetical protein
LKFDLVYVFQKFHFRAFLLDGTYVSYQINIVSASLVEGASCMGYKEWSHGYFQPSSIHNLEADTCYYTPCMKGSIGYIRRDQGHICHLLVVEFTDVQY